MQKRGFYELVDDPSWGATALVTFKDDVPSMTLTVIWPWARNISLRDMHMYGKMPDPFLAAYLRGEE